MGVKLERVLKEQRWRMEGPRARSASGMSSGTTLRCKRIGRERRRSGRTNLSMDFIKDFATSSRLATTTDRRIHAHNEGTSLCRTRTFSRSSRASGVIKARRKKLGLE